MIASLTRHAPLTAHPENDVTALEKAEKDRSSLQVIAATPIDGGGNGCLPTRLVLKDLGDQYVTHLQVFNRDGSHQGFCYGNYYAWGRYAGHCTQITALRKAVDDLARRAREYGYAPNDVGQIRVDVLNHQADEREAAQA